MPLNPDVNVPIELYSLVFRFLKDTGLSRTAELFKKETNKPIKDLNQKYDLVEVFKSYNSSLAGKNIIKVKTESVDSSSSSEISSNNEENEKSSDGSSSSSEEDDQSSEDGIFAKETNLKNKSVMISSENSPDEKIKSDDEGSSSSEDDSTEKENSEESDNADSSFEGGYEGQNVKINEDSDSSSSSDEDEESDKMNVDSSNESVSSSNEKKQCNVVVIRDSKRTNSSSSSSSDTESEKSDSEFENGSKLENTLENIQNKIDNTNKSSSGSDLSEESDEENSRDKSSIDDSKCHNDVEIVDESSSGSNKSETSNQGSSYIIIEKNSNVLINGDGLKHKLDSTNTLDDSIRPSKKLNSGASVTTHFKPISVHKNQRNKSNKMGNKNNGNFDMYNRRTNPEKVDFLDERLKDNSFLAKDGAINSYGYKAYNDLSVTRGKDFRAQKTKKKRGSYRGGKIDLEPHSIKFTVED